MGTQFSAAAAEYIAVLDFGAPPIAKSGKLIFCMAGLETATATIQPYVEGVMEKYVIGLSEDAFQTNLLEISG